MSLLIVTALAGAPVAKVICDLTCLAESTASSAAHTACHEARHESAPALKAVTEVCARDAAAGAFVPQGTYKVPPPAGGTSVIVAVDESLRELRRDEERHVPRAGTGPPLGRTVTVLRI